MPKTLNPKNGRKARIYGKFMSTQYCIVFIEPVKTEFFAGKKVQK